MNDVQRNITEDEQREWDALRFMAMIAMKAEKMPWEASWVALRMDYANEQDIRRILGSETQEEDLLNYIYDK